MDFGAVPATTVSPAASLSSSPRSSPLSLHHVRDQGPHRARDRRRVGNRRKHHRTARSPRCQRDQRQPHRGRRQGDGGDHVGAVPGAALCLRQVRHGGPRLGPGRVQGGRGKEHHGHGRHFDQQCRLDDRSRHVPARGGRGDGPLAALARGPPRRHDPDDPAGHVSLEEKSHRGGLHHDREHRRDAAGQRERPDIPPRHLILPLQGRHDHGHQAATEAGRLRARGFVAQAPAVRVHPAGHDLGRHLDQERVRHPEGRGGEPAVEEHLPRRRRLDAHARAHGRLRAADHRRAAGGPLVRRLGGEGEGGAVRPAVHAAGGRAQGGAGRSEQGADAAAVGGVMMDRGGDPAVRDVGYGLPANLRRMAAESGGLD